MEDVQATARWANRMLRPLTSIYRRLEKHQETPSSIAAESRLRERAENAHGHAPVASAVARTTGNCVSSDADEDDPVWIPGKKFESHRIRHKYSTRGEQRGKRRRNRLSIRSPNTPRTLPGAIELATPLITGKTPPSTLSQHSAQQLGRRKAQGHLQAFRDRYPLHKSYWQELLRQTDDPGFAGIAHNLDRVFANFLCNTRIPKHDPNQCLKSNLGARSLLSLVMRRLPEFIASEQEAQDELEWDRHEDMCNAYFTELETFYAPHGKGWKPLREAVRAQGIYLVGMMIQNEWMTGRLACALIERCRYHDTDACESLLSTFLSTHKAYPYPPTLGPVGISDPHDDSPQLLHFYASHNSVHRSFIFDELAKLLLRGILPPEWMATKLWTSWITRATISISRQDETCAAASRLIEAVLVSASDVRSAGVAVPVLRHPVKQRTARARTTRASSTAPATDQDLLQPCSVSVQDALSNHVMSLMAALCGMHISRSRKEDPTNSTDGTKASNIISYLIFAVERQMDLRPLSHHPEITSHHLLRRGCIWLSNCLLQCNDAVLSDIPCDIPPKPNIDIYLQTLASRAELVKELASFVRQAFRCLESTTESECDQYGQEIRRMISRLPRMSDAPGVSTLLGRVAAEAAMAFAESTADPDDHVWAIEIQEAVVAIQNDKESAHDSMDEMTDCKTTTGPYRWEESIGEWVARTPMAKSKQIIPAYCSRKRASTPTPAPYTPISSDTSSSDRDCFDSASSMSSSPSSVATKRTLDDTDFSTDTEFSTLRPTKRQRSTSVAMFYNGKSDENMVPDSRSTSVSSSRGSIGLESLRARTTPNEAAAAKVEVLIINDSEPSEPDYLDLVSPAEPVEKRVGHPRRRRMGRPRLAAGSRTLGASIPRRTSIVPCSQDEDSDDELSFL